MARARTWRRKGEVSRTCALMRGFRDDCFGTTAIEYGMIGFLVFAVAAGAIRVYGTKLNTVYSTIGTTVSQAQ